MKLGRFYIVLPNVVEVMCHLTCLPDVLASSSEGLSTSFGASTDSFWAFLTKQSLDFGKLLREQL